MDWLNLPPDQWAYCQTCRRGLEITEENFRGWVFNLPGLGYFGKCSFCQDNSEWVRRAYRLHGRNGGEVTGLELAERWQEQGGKCAYCQADLEATGFDIDHVVPVSEGGRGDIHNLVFACPTCNLGKGKKDVDEWLASRA